MPLTALDPNTALIVIDLQKGIVNGNFIHPIGEVVDRTSALIHVFRAKNLPVVLVNVTGRASGRTEQGPRGNTSFSEDGPTFCRSWISNRAISSSRSEAGARLQRRILNASSRREALRRWF